MVQKLSIIISKEPYNRFILMILVGALLPLLFFHENERYVTNTGISILGTFIYWEGNFQIFGYWHKRFPKYTDIWSRVWRTLLSITAYCLFATFLLGGIIHYLVGVELNREDFWNNYQFGLFITLFISSIYETVATLRKWKEVVVEKEKLSRKQIESQYESLKQQVNPHFLFNSLNVLSSLMHTDLELADKFIKEFSNLFRAILDARDKTVVTLSHEITILESYIFLQKMRYGNNLLIESNIENNYLQRYLPPMSVQMQLENCIKHNEISEEKPLHVKITTHHDIIVIENNYQPRNEKLLSTGVGIQNLIEKYKLISDKSPEFFQQNGSFIAKIPLIEEE